MTVEEIPDQVGDDKLFYWVEIGVWFVWVEDLVAVHYCDEVFGVGEVDDVVGVARKHMHCFDLVSAHLEVQDFVASYPALLDEAVAADNDEELPLGVVPVLAFCDARLADVDAHLSAVQSVDEFGE